MNTTNDQKDIQDKSDWKTARLSGLSGTWYHRIGDFPGGCYGGRRDLSSS